MRLVALGSGSRGNATLVELAGTRLLVDAGMSARMLTRRLSDLGVEPGSLQAVLLSHEHQDHARGAERFSRSHGVPVFSTPETLEAMNCSRVHFADWHPLNPGTEFDVAGVRVDPFTVPHDAARPVGFVLEAKGTRMGVVTDLGQATTLVQQRLKGCELIMVESNHDDGMLMSGPYPWELKQRVGGRLGHLSNEEAAELLRQCVTGECRTVVLAHLSENNNSPELAHRAVSGALRRAGRGTVPLHVAESRSPSPPIVL